MDPDVTRLRESFERLADEPTGAPPSSVPPPDLVRQLRRRQRNPRTRGSRTPLVPALLAAAAVFAILVGSAVALPALLRGTGSDVAARTPAPDELVGAIPTSIEVPGEWIATDQTPGVAAAAMPWTHARWFGGVSYDGVVVVSAETGEYTWLELPVAYADTPAVALSPTGRFLAYWAGESRPRTANGLFLDDKVTDLRVRDLVTGDEVAYAPRDAPRGVLSDSESLVWTDETTVAADFYRIDEIDASGSSASGGGVIVMDGESGAATVTTDGPFATAVGNGGAGAPGPVLQRGRPGSGEIVVFTPEGEVDERLARPQTGSFVRGSLSLNPGRSQFVSLRGSDGQSQRARELLVTQAVPAAGTPAESRLLALDRLEVVQLLGWRDDGRVIASAVRIRPDGRTVERGFPVGPPIVSIDVRTGEWETVSRAPSITGLDVAEALWARPTVERDVDPSPTDPRLLGAGWLLVAGGFAWWVRGRRARRDA